MYVLGLSFFYHDGSAALVKDGVVIAAAEEERFTRRKHDPGYPEKAIASVDGTFIWAIEDERGIYTANVDFPDAGRYGAQYTTAEGGAATSSFFFSPRSHVRSGHRNDAAVSTRNSSEIGRMKRMLTSP